VDITALRTLEEVIVDLAKRKVRVILTEANERVSTKLKRAGIVDLVGADNLQPSLGKALERSAVLSASVEH
jgi:SulP family sulfate permease